VSTQPESEALLAAARDAVLVVDDVRTFVDVNPAACRLLGLSAQHLRGRRFDDFLERGVDLERAWQSFLASGEQTGELRVIRPDGEIRHVEYSATARFIAGRHVAILRDIAGRKRAEAEREELRRREQLRLRETETLLAVSRALGATLDPTETMRRVAREIALALGADTVGAYRADAARESLWPVAGYRVPRDMLDTFQRIPIPIKNHRAIEEAWTLRRAVWTDDMPGDARVDPQTLRQFPHQSDLFVPIRIKDRPVGGFFVIWWTARRTFTEWEIRLLEGISDLAGIFLENAQLYREMAEANRAKDEFLATLSHELRNPLGAIANAVAALDRRGGGPEDAASRLCQIIHRQTRHLARLVDDLLDVARATAGKIALERQPVDLSEVAGGCLGALRESGRAVRHRVRFQAESVIVNADPTRLAQIITNMLDNAVKFTPTGGSVDVEVVRDGQEAVLRVRDTGVGIDPGTLPRVFELFAQAEQPMDRSVGGLGIGLTLSRRLVELHGGTISAASEGQGRGAEFTVRLPVEVAGTPPTIAAVRDSDRSRSVLIIEDNDDARESLRLLVESLGHRVVAAGDGRLGLDLALHHRPEVVLIDLGLPGLDGYEVARAVRESPGGKTMRLVAVTGYGQAGDRTRSKEAGFDAHVVKPVSQSLLSSLIAAP
jgi:PAS domain S-box-containing protein